MPVLTRKTRQKDAIRETFITADRPLSPDEVLELARGTVESMSIATVYRNISTLIGEKWLTTVQVPGEPSRYELSGKAHHHHFRCNDCGKIFDLAGCAMPDRQRLPRGFRVTSHEFFLFGSCAACS